MQQVFSSPSHRSTAIDLAILARRLASCAPTADEAAFYEEIALFYEGVVSLINDHDERHAAHEDLLGTVVIDPPSTTITK